MRFPSSVGGTIVVFDGEVVPELRKLARKHALAMLEVEASEQALRHIQSTHPCVVIVQLGPNGKEPLRFIQLATAEARRAPVIVAATEHSLDLERLAVRAGAKIYAPGVTSALLEPWLSAILSSEKEDGR